MKLRPCPFCGRKKLSCGPLGDFGPVNQDAVLLWWIIECKCGGQVITEGKEMAIRVWEKRI